MKCNLEIKRISIKLALPYNLKSLNDLKGVLFFFAFVVFTAQVVRGQDYFPLEIGNRWVYERLDRPGEDTSRIIDTTKIKSKMYYKFLETIVGLDWNVHTYYRKDSLDQVWILNKQTLKEHIVFKLNVPQGTVWYDYQSNLTYLHTLVDTSWIQPTPTSTFEHCYYYNTLIEELYTDFRDFLAPNVGLIRRESEGEGSILKGAWVDGVMYGDTTTTEVKEIEDITTPEVCTLHQNYPNPFNLSTTISYSLKGASSFKTQLTIYNISGMEVITLIDERQGAGEYSVVWYGKDNSGKEVSSDVYFYELAVGKFRSFRKLILTK